MRIKIGPGLRKAMGGRKRLTVDKFITKRGTLFIAKFPFGTGKIEEQEIIAAKIVVSHIRQNFPPDWWDIDISLEYSGMKNEKALYKWFIVIKGTSKEQLEERYGDFKDFIRPEIIEKYKENLSGEARPVFFGLEIFKDLV